MYKVRKERKGVESSDWRVFGTREEKGVMSVGGGEGNSGKERGGSVHWEKLMETNENPI